MLLDPHQNVHSKIDSLPMKTGASLRSNGGHKRRAKVSRRGQSVRGLSLHTLDHSPVLPASVSWIGYGSPTYEAQECLPFLNQELFRPWRNNTSNVRPMAMRLALLGWPRIGKAACLDASSKGLATSAYSGTLRSKARTKHSTGTQHRYLRLLWQEH